MPPERAWVATPWELDLMMRAAGERRRREEELAILSGWMAGYCMRVKRFPSLETLLKRRKPAHTPEEQARMLDLLLRDR